MNHCWLVSFMWVTSKPHLVFSSLGTCVCLGCAKKRVWFPSFLGVALFFCSFCCVVLCVRHCWFLTYLETLPVVWELTGCVSECACVCLWAVCPWLSLLDDPWTCLWRSSAHWALWRTSNLLFTHLRTATTRLPVCAPPNENFMLAD